MDIIFFKERYWIYVFCSGVFCKPIGFEHKWKLFYEEKQDCNFGRNLKSFGNSLIIGNKNKLTIVEVNGDEYTKLRTIENGIISGSSIRDFAVSHIQIFILTKNNHIGVYNKRAKKLYEVFIGEGIGENLIICDRNKYLFVSERDENLNSTVIRVFKINNGTLEELKMLNTKRTSARCLDAFCLFGYIGNFIIFSGVESTWNYPKLFTFRYDIEENVLEEIRELREEINLSYVEKLFKKCDGSVVGVSRENSLLEFKYKLTA